MISYYFECKLPRGVILVELRAKLMEFSSLLVLSKILRFTMTFAEYTYLPGELWSFLSFGSCRIVFVFHFLEWVSEPNLAPARFVALGRHALHHQKHFRPFLPLGKLDTISHHLTWLCPEKNCIRFPCFPPNMRIPQISGVWKLGSLPPRVNVAIAAATFKIDSVVRGVHDVFELPDVLPSSSS